MQVQLPHDVAAMGLGGLHTQVEMGSYFLTALALSQKLNDFTLTRRQTRQRHFTLSARSIATEVPAQHHIGHSRSEESLVRLQGFDRSQKVPGGVRFQNK